VNARAPETTSLYLGDIEVAYRERGEGPPVILVHGLAQDHRMWAEQQDALPDFQTIAYDVRGHGRTTAGEGEGTLAQLGGDLVALLERFGPATVVGFSLGGTVALWAAAERPDLVTDVVAIATSSVVGGAAAEFFADRIALFGSRNREAIEAALREDTAAQLAGAEVELDPVVRARLEAVGDGAGYVNAARAMAAINGAPLNGRLEAIEQPVKVLSGERDRFCPRRAAEIMLEHLPDGRFEELPGVGHLVTDEAPAEVSRVLGEWLRGGSGL
jgi:pimeloyl-ACP methyl ester carboxylesterase